MARKKINRRRDKPKVAEAKANRPKVETVNGRTRTTTRNPPPDDLNPYLNWYLVYTAPRAEAKAKQELEDAGCKVFWPSEHVVITAPKRKPIEYDVGTFHRYLFVAGMPFRERRRDRVVGDNEVITINGRPIDDIRDVAGVVEVVGTAKGWLRVPSAAIIAIAGYQERKEEPTPEFRFGLGDRVLINDGPLKEFFATVEAIGMAKASVIVDILGGRVPVQLDVRQLDAA